MIGLHRDALGGQTMRRDEKPLRRRNPSGEFRFVARYTNKDDKRVSAGTFAKKGPCKAPASDGQCCAQHAIWAAYEAESAPAEPEAVVTVGSFFYGTEPRTGWLDRYPRRERTEASYRGILTAQMGVVIEGVPFRDWPLVSLRRKQIAALLDVVLRVQGRSAAGAAKVMSTLSTMFEDAITDGAMDSNPARGLRVPEKDPRVRRPKRKRFAMTWEQMHHFAACAGPREPMVRVLSDCGLRLGEMLALERCHDCRDHLLVENTAWDGHVSEGTKQSDGRVVPIPPGLRVVLDAYATPLHGPLFPSPSGGWWHARSFYRSVWIPAQERSGLIVWPHDMRHSFISLMRAAGVDPADLARATGQTVATATAIYTHSTGQTFDLMRASVG